MQDVPLRCLGLKGIKESALYPGLLKKLIKIGGSPVGKSQVMRYLTLVHPSTKWFNITGKVVQNDRAVGSNASVYTMNSYIYIYDAEELSFDEKIDITNYGGTHYKAILFDNNILFSNSVDSGDHPCNTVCIYSINDKTIETISFDQYYPLDLAVWDNILIVSHFDLVKREGGSISIYNLETKELNNIELGHDVEQMTINENVIYILSDKIIYQYELKDMNLYLKCKTQIKKSNEENYLSGIFYIKPESMKFTL